MPNYAVQSITNPMRGLYRGDTGYSFGALTSTAIAASPGGLVRAASGTVTLTTSGAHNFTPGEVLTIADTGPAGGGKVVSVGGTRFGGNYLILTTPSGTTATLLPLDEVVLHQAADTGGSGAATSIAFENPAGGTAGKAFALANIGDPSVSPWGFFVDGIFQAAPTFEVDVQVAAVDADTQYQTMSGGNVTTADATNFTFHLDATFTGAKFVRLKMKTNTGNVGFIGRIRG
jgi:hypothetical protein